MAQPVSAKGGSLTIDAVPIPDVTAVTVNEACELQEYGSSSTSGQIAREDGLRDCTVTATILSDGGAFDPGFVKGDIVALIATSAAGKTVTGNFLVISISNDIPIGDGGLQAHNVEFGLSDGAIVSV